MKATTVLALEIDEASAKVRTGPPADDDTARTGRCWDARPLSRPSNYTTAAEASARYGARNAVTAAST